MLIEQAASLQHEALTATALLDVWTDRGSTPIKVEANDGNLYVAKGLWRDRERGRAIAVDYVVSRLGKLLGAPVAEVAIVTIPEALIATCSTLAGMIPGPTRGSRWIPNCRDIRRSFDDCDVEGNREGLALLATLYGWIGDWNELTDMQYLCCGGTGQKIMSVDHDVFWQALPLWDDTKELLYGVDAILGYARSASKAMPYSPILNRLGGDDYVKDIAEISRMRECLAQIRERDVAMAIGSLPIEWGIDMDVQVAIAVHLWARRSQLLEWLSSR